MPPPLCFAKLAGLLRNHWPISAESALRETVCQTAEEFKAWSQKLATSDVMPIHVNISPHGNKHHRNIIFVDDFIARMIAQPRHQRARFVTDYQVGFNQFRVGFPAWAGLPGV